jgi:hypothetical protein
MNATHQTIGRLVAPFFRGSTSPGRDRDAILNSGDPWGTPCNPLRLITFGERMYVAG